MMDRHIPRDTRVLLVDDEPDCVECLAFLLEDAGFELDTASNAEEALGKVASHPPNVLVTDLLMPSIGGVELAREVRERVPGVRVVLMTGLSLDAVPTVADAVVRKPIDADALVPLLDRLTRSAGERRRDGHD